MHVRNIRMRREMPYRRSDVPLVGQARGLHTMNSANAQYRLFLIKLKNSQQPALLTTKPQV